MKKTFSLCCLSIFFILFGVNSIFAAAIPSTDSVPVKNLIQQKLVEASTFMEQGNYEQAYAAYSRLLREYPEDDSINLGYARSAIRHNKPGHAVMAYERLLTKYPNEPILLKELAYALSMQNDSQRAKMELAKNPDSNAEENASLAEKWSKQHSRTQFSGRIRTGVIFDSNVNGGPASNELSIGRWDLKLDNVKAQNSMSEYLGAQIDVGHRLATSSPWWIVGGANAFARYNNNTQLYDMKLSSSAWGSASAGIRYLGSKSMLDVRARTQIFDYGFVQNIFAVGPTATFAYALNPKVHLITRASADSRSYNTNTDYNGWYGSAGQYVRVFFGDAGHNLTFGGKYIGGSAEISRLTYDGYEANLDFTFVLPYEIHLSPFIAYGGEYYYAPATTLEKEYRQDHIVRTGLNFEMPITEDWSVEASYQYMKNYSNSALYEYDQHLTRLGISWAF